MKLVIFLPTMDSLRNFHKAPPLLDLSQWYHRVIISTTNFFENGVSDLARYRALSVSLLFGSDYCRCMPGWNPSTCSVGSVQSELILTIRSPHLESICSEGFLAVEKSRTLKPLIPSLIERKATGKAHQAIDNCLSGPQSPRFSS